jgi:hypothetical protein
MIVYNNSMKIGLLRSVTIGLVVLFLLMNQGVTSAQVEQSRYFPETGHWVTGEFLVKYESTPNPEQVYGYPITDAFSSELSRSPAGTLIQYFERARFELFPENLPELRVTLTPLGEYFLEVDSPGRALSILTNPSACRNIPEGGFQVCYAFLLFFDNQGGIAQFGYPISGLVIQGDRLVQYFQRARFEWRPELPSGQRVMLTDVGYQFFYSVGENADLIQPSPDAVLTDLLELQVSTFVNRSVLPPNGLQEVYVVVQNQYLMAVPGAQVVIHVRMPSGEVQDYSMPITDSNGVSAISFIVQDEPTGQVHIVVDVRTSNLLVTSETSFRIWK